MARTGVCLTRFMQRGLALATQRLSSRHLLPGPTAPSVQSVAGQNLMPAPMGPGDRPRDDGGVYRWRCQSVSIEEPYPCSSSGFRLPFSPRSEEHTSELQSLMRISYAVFCLKKKNKYSIINTYHF